MRETNSNKQSIGAAGPLLSDISDQLHVILAELDKVTGAEIIAIHIAEAIDVLEAANALNVLWNRDKPSRNVGSKLTK